MDDNEDTDGVGLNDVKLLVGGLRFGGWERAEVQDGIEQCAGQFALDVTLQWPDMDEPVPVREGLPCAVWIGPDLVSTGYIDDFEPDYTATTGKVRVTGRSKAADLVDCSAMNKPGQWRNVLVDQIIREIAAPFSITVSSDTDLGEKLPRFALEDGEKAWDAIDRAARMRALLVISTPEGNLLITRASTVSSGVELIEGVNMKTFGARHSWKERYSLVVMKGQSPGDDFQSGATVAQQKAQAVDAEIDRYRPLIVVAEHNASTAALADRAKWEVLVRMGRGKRGQCLVVGWRTGQDGQEGPLWQKNTLVRVTSPRMSLDMDMLIVGLTFTFSEEGRVTLITFARPEAFQLVEGVGKSKLTKRLNDKTQREKKRKGDGAYTPSWELTPPNPKADKPSSTP